MYAVKCYFPETGTQLLDTDYFDTYDDARNFAEMMAEDNFMLVDIECPNGTTICL